MRGVVTLHKLYEEYADNSNKQWLPALTMRRVAILLIEQYGECRLSAINNSRESIQNRVYLIEFEVKFEKSLNTD